MELSKLQEDTLKEMIDERIYEKAKKVILEKYKSQILAVQNASNKLLQDRQRELKAVIDKQDAEIAAIEK